MEEKKKDLIPEIGEEELDKVSGGNGPVILDPEYDDYFAGLPGLLPKRKGTAEKPATEGAPGSDA